MTSYDYFARAEEIERVCAEIYTELARDFADDPPVSATFRQLANEELQHAARTRLLRNQYRSNPSLFGQMERLEEELSAIETDAMRLRDEVVRGVWSKDLAGVRARLVAMEDRLHVHAETMARRADPRVRAFFETLAQQDEAHRRLCAGTPCRKAGST